MPPHPNGLGQKYNSGSLSNFLRAHYTTKRDSASALAKYGLEFAALRPVVGPTTENVMSERSFDARKGSGAPSVPRLTEDSGEIPCVFRFGGFCSGV